jgi:putative ABC transport system permease protein
VVIGIMPPAHADLEIGRADAWVPIYYNSAELRAKPVRSRYVRVVGRLKPGITVAQAQAEMDVIERQLAQEKPSVYAGWQIVVEPLREATSGRAKPALLLSMGAVFLVLLAASITIANLLIAQAAVRQREWALRMALGASRWRVLREWALQGLLLSLLGVSAGLPLAYGGIRLLIWLQPELSRAGGSR